MSATSDVTGSGSQPGSGSGSRCSCGKRTRRSSLSRASFGRGNGRAPDERVVQRRAQAPDVGGRPDPPGHRLRIALLGRHVGVGADDARQPLRTAGLRAIERSIRRGGAPMMMLSGLTSRWT